MRKFNKFLCTILTLIMMLGCMGSTVLAVSSITENRFGRTTKISSP